MESRNGIAINGCVTQATGRAEPAAAMAMAEAIPGWHRLTLGADKGCDSQELVEALRDHQVTPHLACKATPIIDERTTRHPGYRLSQQKRKRIEEILRLAQNGRRAAPNAPSRRGPGRLDVSLRTGRL